MYDHGERVGTWTGYFMGGAKLFEGEYGPYVPGALAEELVHDDQGIPVSPDEPNSLQGTWMAYYENGMKRLLLNYVNGVQMNAVTGWHEAGHKAFEGSLFWETEDGAWAWWWPNGAKQAEGTIAGSERVGRWTFWHDNGQRLAEGAYDGGAPVGKWTYWYPGGGKWEEGEYDENGDKSDTWTSWTALGEKTEQVIREPEEGFYEDAG